MANGELVYVRLTLNCAHFKLVESKIAGGRGAQVGALAACDICPAPGNVPRQRVIVDRKATLLAVPPTAWVPDWKR